MTKPDAGRRSRHATRGSMTAGSPGAPTGPLSFVVVGSCIVDFCVRVPRLPGRGETVLAESVTRSLGGKGANQATALRRLGGEVAIVAGIGADDFGAAFLEGFGREGIETRFVHRDAAAPTGVAFPMLLPGGGNAIVAAPAASMALPVVAVEAAAERIRGASALLLQLEVPAAAAAAAMAIARAAGVPVYLNPAPFVAAAPRLAAGADVLIPNEVEAAALTGAPLRTPEDALQSAERLRALGPAAVVVTLGEQGAALSAPGIRRFAPAFVVEAVDSTGAGDAFCAGLVDARCRGGSWAEALDFACACGALACRGAGAIPWLPTAAAVRELLARDRRRAPGS
ncbi:MAG TPA: ribokinase [Thermoanaerobaculia bacterium]|nr:ribokinase [Thermoanaerobaculia bacterium]